MISIAAGCRADSCCRRSASPSPFVRRPRSPRAVRRRARRHARLRHRRRPSCRSSATGWNTVLLDHFTMQVADYQKEAAYYAALMNWKVRSDDGKQAVLDIGDWGGVIIRGGYEPPPAPTPPAGANTDTSGGRRCRRPQRPDAAVVVAAVAAEARRGSPCVDSLLLGHRAVGREEGRSRAQEARPQSRGGQRSEAGFPELPRSRIRTASICRSATATARTAARGPRAPSSRCRRRSRRRTGRRSGSITSRSRCTDYKEAVAFYDALLGWKPGTDEGSQNQVQIGDIGDAIIRRGGGGGRGGGAADPAAPACGARAIGHIAFGIRRGIRTP